MKRLAAPLRCLPLALLGSCTCGNKGTPATMDAAQPTSNAASAVADARSGPRGTAGAVFSAPIGAARVGRTDVVAGLVAAEGVVRVAGVRDGQPSWSADVLRGVSWAPDVEVKMQPAGDGVALVWRGPRGGKSGRTLVLLGPQGETRAEPTEIGAAFCTTSDGVAWLDPHTTGPAHVRARRWTDPAVRDMVAVSPGRDPGLVCGDHDVVVLGDGDDDLTAVVFALGDASPQKPTVAIRDADFGDDDEREHDPYSNGDDLGLVRVGSSGAISLREVKRAVAAPPWRKLKHTLSADDDVVAVDGDANATLVVFTRDADDACPGIGSTAESVHALRVDRRSGEESLLDLAPADCDSSRGPFWIAAAPAAPVVAWVERRTKLPVNAAPVSGVAFRVVRADGVRPGRIDLLADAVADGGCDSSGCSVAALVRAPEGDGMQPSPIRLFGYP